MNDRTEANRLAAETSPYLLQHAHNPVSWFPWGQEALDRARAEDKPILLSIGYAACHWCHVMERESFESEEIAALMNEHFVCIKVDREERPDLDDIYMTAVQIMTGSGGWPLTVFLTPELKPFFGGTYFPPEDRFGRPGFPTVLQAVASSYVQRRDRVEAAADELSRHLETGMATPDPTRLLTDEPIAAAVRELRSRFDPRYGGFSPAPKFPHSTVISLLLRVAHHRGELEALRMATVTLDRMAAGGMYDHLGGGFHRYSTDAEWLVPHFEKMLYDNALLAGAYLEAHQLTGSEEYARVARETLNWVLRDMEDEGGGYYSTLDADSEGVEGKFYVWSQEQVRAALGDDADLFCRVYDVTAGGNWEGKSILNLRAPRDQLVSEASAALGHDEADILASLERSRARLLEVRGQRPRPGLDDKVLTDWNGLMITAMAHGHRVLGDDRYLRSAERAARFILASLVRDGRLLHTYREGQSKLLAYLDDYAYLLRALVELYAASFDIEWLRQARRIADEMVRLFWDDGDSVFAFTGSDHEQLIARPKRGHDGATPAGNAVAAASLQVLATLTGEDAYARRAVQTLRSFQPHMARSPSGFAQMLIALDIYLSEPREVAVVGELDDAATQQALRRLWGRYEPNEVIAVLDPATDDPERWAAEVPLLQGKSALDGELTYYLCSNFACKAPTTDLNEVLGT